MALKRKIKQLRKQGKKIAFTNGCFDILHFGHIRYLESAKKATRILIVGLNTDVSVRKIKGPDRPINNQLYRAAVLASLACVDFVVFFREDTPYRLIQALKPDILIKGADWQGKKIVGSDIVKSYGGKVELIPYVSDCSTSRIIESIRKSAKRH